MISLPDNIGVYCTLLVSCELALGCSHSFHIYIYYVLCSGLSVFCFTKLPKSLLWDNKTNGEGRQVGNMLVCFLVESSMRRFTPSQPGIMSDIHRKNLPSVWSLSHIGEGVWMFQPPLQFVCNIFILQHGLVKELIWLQEMEFILIPREWSCWQYLANLNLALWMMCISAPTVGEFPLLPVINSSHICD